MKSPKKDQEPNTTVALATPLPDGWQWTTVEAVGSVRLGRQRSPDKHTGLHPTPYIRAANITSQGVDVTDVLSMDFTPAEQRLFRLLDGDVLLAEASGSASQVGRSAIWRNELPGCCYQNTVIRFRPHAVTPEFARLAFRHFSLTGIFARAARGVGIQHLGASRFSALPFPLPPHAEQIRIAAEVSTRMADLRSAETSLASALRRIAEQERAILAAAVAGTLVENHEGDDEHRSRRHSMSALPYQPDLFHKIDDSSAERNLPQLSPGWRWRHIDELGEVRLGKQLSPQEERGPNQRRYLRVANVFEDEIDVTDVKSMHFSDEEFATYRLQPGDVLLNEGQSPELVGRPALYHGEIPDVCFQNTLIRFRAGGEIAPEYALLVFRQYLHAGEFRRIARWSTNIAHLGLQRFASMAIPVPPLGVQMRIVSEARRRLEASRSQQDAVRSSLDRIPAMERQLLEAAVTGALVPQNPTDEPARTLLQRMGTPVDAAAIDNKRQSAQRGTPLTQRPRKPKHADQPKLPLDSVLRSSGRALSVPELFSLAGYDRDSTAEVEQFYIALRDSVGRTIRQTTTGENAILEALPNASP
jgi:type I restriction enzyme S subunit